MNIEGRVFCEGPECERSAHINVNAMAAGLLPITFLKVVERSDRGVVEAAFCGKDCLMKWAAQHPPEEIIPAFDPPAED